MSQLSQTQLSQPQLTQTQLTQTQLSQPSETQLSQSSNISNDIKKKSKKRQKNKKNKTKKHEIKSMIISRADRQHWFTHLDNAYPIHFSVARNREKRMQWFDDNGNDLGKYMVYIDPKHYVLVEEYSKNSHMWSNDGIGGQYDLFNKINLKKQFEELIFYLIYTQ